MHFGEICTKCGKLIISCVCTLIAVSVMSAELLWKINPHEEEHKHAHRDEARVAFIYTGAEGTSTSTSSSSGAADDLSWMPLDTSPPRRPAQENMPWLYGEHISGPIWSPEDNQ